MPKGNPQLEDGYTPIANELLESLFFAGKYLSKTEVLLLLIIMRKTYGWRKKEAPISYRHFVSMTGFDYRNVHNGIKNLMEKELILRSQGAKLKYGKPVYNYQISKKGLCKYNISTDVNRTSEPDVNRTSIKTIKENLNKGRRALVDKLSAPK